MLTKEDQRFIADVIDKAFTQRTASFATKDDLAQMEKGIRQDMATKDDLKRFATKDDLKRFATKDDLKRFATKDDLKRFASKDDMAGMESGIRKDLAEFATRDDLAGMEKRMKKEIREEVRQDIHDEVEGLAAITQNEFGRVHDSLAATNKKLDGLVAMTQDHDYYIRELRIDTDRLKQHTGLTDRSVDR